MTLTQQQANDLASIQSQLVQMGNTVQQLNMLTNSLTSSRASIQNNLRTIQASINAVNQEVGRQLATGRVR
jgi:K+/H+ antiporter YhaU regulatory subunit KhtT